MDQQCPRCGRISQAPVLQCECGWNFATISQPPSTEESSEDKYGQHALLSVGLPIAAWIAQIAFAVMVGPSPATRSTAMILLLAQFVMIVAGLNYGLKAITVGRPFLSPVRLGMAIVGVVLSVGTIAIIVMVAAIS